MIDKEIMQAIKSDPLNSTLLYMLAESFLSIDKVEEAIRALRLSLIADPNFFPSYKKLGRIFQTAGRNYEAASAYVGAILCNRFEYDLYVYLAKSLRDLGRVSEAENCEHASCLGDDIVYEFHSSLKCFAIRVESLLDRMNDSLCTITLVLETTFDELKTAHPPQILDGDLPKAFYVNNPRQHLPNAYIAKLKDGLVWVDKQGVLVTDVNNRFLVDFSVGESILMYCSPKHQISRIQGRVASLTTKWGSSFFHWMTDVLGRICILTKAGFSVDDFDYFILDFDDFPYQRETLNRLGISIEKVIKTSSGISIQADELIVPSKPSTPGWTQAWTAEFAKNLFLTEALQLSSCASGKRIFVSRSKARYRRIRNEEEVWKVLAKRGFQKVFLEDIELSAQALIFYESDFIVAPHGAGLSNILFCRSGVSVLEILSPDYVNVCYWSLSNVVGVRYHYLLGLSGITEDQFYPQKDINVPIHTLERLVDQIISVQGTL